MDSPDRAQGAQVSPLQTQYDYHYGMVFKTNPPDNGIDVAEHPEYFKSAFRNLSYLYKESCEECFYDFVIDFAETFQIDRHTLLDSKKIKKLVNFFKTTKTRQWKHSFLHRDAEKSSIFSKWGRR